MAGRNVPRDENTFMVLVLHQVIGQRIPIGTVNRDGKTFQGEVAAICDDVKSHGIESLSANAEAQVR